MSWAFFRSAASLQCGRIVSDLVSLLHCTLAQVNTSLRYTAERLRQLGTRKCCCLNRKIRRRLVYFKLFNHHIPVVVTLNRDKPILNHQNESPRSKVLVDINCGKDDYKRKQNYSNGRTIINPSVLLTNVRSLSNKKDELSMLMASFKPDFAALTETWLDNSTSNSSISIPRYSIARIDRNARGGGIVCYIREGLSFELIQCDVPCDTEILAFMIKKWSILIIIIYHPFWANKQKDSECINAITSIMDTVLTSMDNESCVKTILCGDFNGLRLNYDEISEVTGLKATVHSPTRNEHVLDQIFTNIPNCSSPTIHPPIGRSDHSIVLLNRSSIRTSWTKKRVRNFSRANKQRFGELISSYDWQAFVNSYAHVEQSSMALQESIKVLYESCFPYRTIRLRNTDPPWVTPQLKLLINDRDKAFNLKQWTKYTRLKNEVICMIKHLKSCSIKNAVSSGNVCAVWKAIKVFGGVNDLSVNTSLSLEAEDFNIFFSSVFQAPYDHNYVVDFSSIPESSYFTHDEVHTCLSKLKRKSTGHDSLPYWIFRDFAHVFTPAITVIFNMCISMNYFPSCMKVAKVIPVPKCTHPKEVSDFRPISLLPILSKVFEKLISKKLILPLIRDRLDQSQFAYFPKYGSGTTSALTLMTNMILSFLDTESGTVRVLSTDFSKAFDKTDHGIILSAMQRFHLPDYLLKLISSYLSDRRQCVFWNDCVSQYSCVTSGVPQGSILGPILFGLVIDSFHPLSENSKVIKYADDLTIFHFIRCPLEDNLQLEWDNCVSWSSTYNLPLNFSKCKVLDIITRKNYVPDPIVTSDGSLLQNVNELKILGVILSSNLKWNSHVKHVVSRASQRIFIIRNLKRSGCSSDLMLKAYISFIRSVLLYAYPCFCNLPSYLFDKLVTVEKRVFRIIEPSNDFPVLSYSADKMCKKLFGNVERNSQHPLRSIFLEQHETMTRNRSCLRIPRSKTVRFKNSFVKYCTCQCT